MDDCRCAILSKALFSRYLRNEKVEAEVYHQSDEHSFELFLIWKGLNDEIEYVKCRINSSS